MKMKRIEVKRYVDNLRETITEHVNVEHSTYYGGVEIFRCTQKWYYVFDGGNWQYFGNLREAKKFIDNLYRG